VERFLFGIVTSTRLLCDKRQRRAFLRGSRVNVMTPSGVIRDSGIMANWDLAGRISVVTGYWGPYLEGALPSTELEPLMERSSIPSFGFFFMLGLSATIASLGLIANSAPAIIGAMIIAPLMGPIISLAYGLVTFQWRMIGRSCLTISTGAIVVVMFAYVASALFGLRIAGSEIISRASPTLLDLGIALAAGGAGAFSHTRKSIASSIAGVAIAVALVPPLAVCGIGLSLGKKAVLETGESLSSLGFVDGGNELVAGALVLFLTNLVGIVSVALLVFALHRYGHWKKALVAFLLITSLAIPLVKPLREELRVLYVKNRVVRLVAKLERIRPDIVAARGRLVSAQVDNYGGRIYVTLEGFHAKDTIAQGQKRIDLFRQYLSREIGQEVELIYRAIVVNEFRVLRSMTKGPKQRKKTNSERSN
jgi:uncharacterized hydrophobic protein (TIGR00271 family)